MGYDTPGIHIAAVNNYNLDLQNQRNINSWMANGNWVRQGEEIFRRLQIYGLMVRNEAYNVNVALNSRLNNGIDRLVNTYHAKTDATKEK